MWDLDVIGVPSRISLIRKASALGRIFPTLDLSIEEKVVWDSPEWSCLTWLTPVCPPHPVGQPPLVLTFFHTQDPTQWLCRFTDTSPSGWKTLTSYVSRTCLHLSTPLSPCPRVSYVLRLVQTLTFPPVPSFDVRDSGSPPQNATRTHDNPSLKIQDGTHVCFVVHKNRKDSGKESRL